MEINKSEKSEPQGKLKPQQDKIMMQQQQDDFYQSSPLSSPLKLSSRFLKRKKILQPFFQGQILDDRMKYIRQKFIQPIRQKYNKQNFYKWLIEWKKKADNHFIPCLQHVQFSYWKDQIKPDKQFFFLKLITSDSGYQFLIKLINQSLRQQKVSDKELQICVAFIQAINIQLFLLVNTKKQLYNFSGKVYRGISCTQKQLKKFLQLQNQPLQKRDISVPLSLWSSTKNKYVAEHFIATHKREGQYSILFQIQILSVEGEDLLNYRKHFPTSVVSTITAVDISQSISLYPEQQQVLLRGAFLTLIKIQKDDLESKKQIVAHCVCTNGNRDHISTNNLKDQTDDARNMFRSMTKRLGYEYGHKFLENYQKQFKLSEQEIKCKEQFKKNYLMQQQRYKEVLLRREKIRLSQGKQAEKAII